MGVAGIPDDSFAVPVIPNRPLKTADEAESFGQVALRKNGVTDLVDNGAFDAELIEYDADYQNNQAVSAIFSDHMQNVLEILKARFPAGCNVVEVGCGKGEFLEMMQADGHFNVSGFDGAYEGSNPAIEKRFLSSDDRLPADLVVLRHVLEHIQRPQEFLQLLSSVFGDAEIYIEVPDFEWIIAQQAFFDITYEHVNYFSSASLCRLFTSVEQQGLLFGEQYQYVIGKLPHADCLSYGSAFDIAENWTPLAFDDLFPGFVSTIEKMDRLSDGKPIYIWGAATKGVMFCHHTRRLLPAAFDRIAAAVDINPMKAGRFMPSVHLPILDVDAFCDAVTDDVLVVIMNPNYHDEIVAELQSRGLQRIRFLSV